MEPILSLAFAMHSNRGVYAVLAGSGMSRAAGMPTGWEVVLDLTEKIARLRGEDCSGDPEGWYRKAFGEEPDYSKLLSRLARSPAERQHLLRAYFEATPDEAIAGRKQPTRCHVALAELVKSGHVRVILTTNFDRLIERSIEAAGLTPLVISTPDAAEGALPLTHATCMVIKLHGDYLDARIKNTPAELDKYHARMKRLLDRVLDEFGLIVCGWSGDWDTALRAALERCKSRRFTTFWTARGAVSSAARKLITHRAAVEFPIIGADEFFSELQQKVSALSSLDAPHPLSIKTAEATMKRMLADPVRNRIELHDMVKREVERVMESTSDARMPVSGAITAPTLDAEIRKRLGDYESITAVLCQLYATGCYWDDGQHMRLWIEGLERLGTRRQTGGETVLIDLRNYPALLTFYSGGLAALARSNYGVLGALFRGPKLRDNGPETDEAARILHPQAVLGQSNGRAVLTGRDRDYTPMNNHVFETLREPLRGLLADDESYALTFDRLEFLQAATCVADRLAGGDSSPGFPAGRFAWRGRSGGAVRVAEVLTNEADKAGTDWGPLLAKLFSSRAEFDAATSSISGQVARFSRY